MFFFQAEDGIRDLVRSRGLGDVYKRQGEIPNGRLPAESPDTEPSHLVLPVCGHLLRSIYVLSLIHI